MITFADRVAEASADWVYIPPEARSHTPGDYSLIAYPDHFVPPTQLFRIRSTRDLGALRAEVDGVARGWGRAEVGWWIDPATRPERLEDDLRAAGARLDVTVAVFGLDLSAGLPQLGPSDDVTAAIVRDDQGFADFSAVNEQVWDAPRLGVEDYERLRRQAEDDHQYRAVAYLDGRPVACAGVSLVGPVARLWGGATLPEQRGRGAYRALLATRMAHARDLGADLALVKGIVTTSAPILRRAGFTEFGEERCYALPVRDA